MLEFLFPFAISAAVTLLLVRSASLHRKHTGDSDFSKPQKVHVAPVPRIGGLGIVLALLGWAMWVWATGRSEIAAIAIALLVCALPAFVAGFIQDCSEAVTPRGRLMATALSAALAFYLLDLGLRHTTIPGLDWVVASRSALLVTVFVVTGVANAVNIIDGFNGLASMCVMLMLGAVAYVAFQVGDMLVALLALAGIGALLGFFVWNFPAGLIFLGRRRRLLPRLLRGRSGDPAAAPQPAGVADVPAAGVHVPGVRDPVLDLPPPRCCATARPACPTASTCTR